MLRFRLMLGQCILYNLAQGLRRKKYGKVNGLAAFVTSTYIVPWTLDLVPLDLEQSFVTTCTVSCHLSCTHIIIKDRIKYYGAYIVFISK